MDSRIGGKIVTNKRKRYAVGPYDRPQQQPQVEEEPVLKSPNWLTGHVFPATRTIISGAAKILTSVFNSDDSSQSSSESDTDSMFEDDAREENDICSEVDELNKHPQLSGERSQIKHLIEQLLMQETFSREERDRLVTIINSRVVDSSSLPEGEGSLGLHSKDDTLDHSSQAIIEARKWLEEKRDGLRSDVTLGGLSSVLKDVDDTFGSPVEMAKSYMKVRPPWASPAVDRSGLRTPSKMKAKLFDEETPYTVSGDSLSSLKKNSYASGSWNIHEEIRKVRSKATEDLLRAHPSKETHYQLRSVERKLEPKSAVGDLTGTSTAEKRNDSSSLRLAKLSDVPIKWSDVEITQDGGESESGPLNPASSIQLQDQCSNLQAIEAIRVGEHAASESYRPNGPVVSSEHNDGLHITGSDAQEEAQPNLAQSSNGYTSLEASLSAGQTRGQNDVHVGGEKPKPGTSSQDKSPKSNQVEEKCELLSESAVDVPDMNETTESPAVSIPSEDLSQEEPGLVRDLAKNGKVVKKRPVRNARKTRAKR
ncbi:protein KAKU4 isoform X1 [Lycium ferocissimum]|uniref:protein KAKU4 isoform X1 n=1 Tax=Lycium ferocissimum TaxID=112874 RepID=UPI0028157DA0|nr:protein KAKU4 isoform X1 [Lycium ferocissimum]